MQGEQAFETTIKFNDNPELAIPLKYPSSYKEVIAMMELLANRVDLIIQVLIVFAALERSITFSETQERSDNKNVHINPKEEITEQVFSLIQQLCKISYPDESPDSLDKLIKSIKHSTIASIIDFESENQRSDEDERKTYTHKQI